MDFDDSLLTDAQTERLAREEALGGTDAVAVADDEPDALREGVDPHVQVAENVTRLAGVVDAALDDLLTDSRLIERLADQVAQLHQEVSDLRGRLGGGE